MSAKTAGASRMRGVTLMELVTAVAIVGILTAIAVPSYRGYVTRVKRTDAKRDLMILAQRLERCFTRSNDYRYLQPGGPGACVTLPFTNTEGTYTVTGDVSATEFELTATPAMEDSKCGNLTLTQAGVQGASGGTMSPQKCWQGAGG